MATEILKSFGNLQNELEQAKSSLKGVDENIKRLIGRDPSELPPRPGLKRQPVNDDKGRINLKNARRNFENDEPPIKRRNPSGVSVFKRLSEKPIHNDIHPTQAKQMISKVIVTPKEIPSRQEAMEAQNKDEKSKARNRRMFGALLGTLQKFQQEETKLKKREDKRAQLEKKIEEHEIKEKEEIKKERQELFFNRRKKQAEIKMIELKMLRMKEYAAWEEQQKPRTHFIMTKAKPHIHYLPRKLNDTSKELLEKSKIEVGNMIEKKRQAVFDELKHIEERMKKNFDYKFGSKEAKEEHIEHPVDDNDNHFDEDGDAMMAELPLPKKEEESVAEEKEKDLNGITQEEISPEEKKEETESSVIDNQIENTVEVSVESKLSKNVDAEQDSNTETTQELQKEDESVSQSTNNETEPESNI